MTEKKLLEKYNAVRQQLENCGRQVMNLKSELAGMRDKLDAKGAFCEYCAHCIHAETTSEAEKA